MLEQIVITVMVDVIIGPDPNNVRYFMKVIKNWS